MQAAQLGENMKYKNIMFSLLLVTSCACFAAQKTTFTQREVRDPRQLAGVLSANATDAESRLIAAAITNGIATMEGGATLDNTTSAAELNITETAVKLTANTTVTGTLGVTGVATFAAQPVFTAVVAAGTVTPAPTNMPTVVDGTAPVWVSIKIGATSYVVPAYAIP